MLKWRLRQCVRAVAILCTRQCREICGRACDDGTFVLLDVCVYSAAYAKALKSCMHKQPSNCESSVSWRAVAPEKILYSVSIPVLARLCVCFALLARARGKDRERQKE